MASRDPFRTRPPGLRLTEGRPPRDTRGRKQHNHIGKDRTDDEVLADEVGKFFHDPLGYVMFMFPWDTEVSIQVIELAEGVEEHLTPEERVYRKQVRARFPGCKYGPDLWACQFLDEVGRETKKRNFKGKPVDPLKMATVSGHEIGKSALVAWLTKWILDTRPGSKGTLTAVTDEQLRTKTWAEVGKWHRISLTEHWYDYNSSRGNMSLIRKGEPEYRADARTCREEKSESFAGQHAPTATSFYIFDEASGIGAKVFEVREGGLTSGEPMVFDFGNGTRNSGEFYEECVGKLKDRFITRSIDSRTVAITNKKKIDQDIEDRGLDSDWVKVRWRGLFPDRGFTQFIGTDLVDKAMEADDLAHNPAPLVIGVDVARFGGDDSVIWPRRGKDARSFPPEPHGGLDTKALLGKIIEKYRFFVNLGTKPAMIFVDEGNTGGAIVDLLRDLGYPVMGVMFGSSPTDKKTYRYKSDEIWGTMRGDIEAGLRLPALDTEHGSRIHAELTQREYGYMVGTERIHLETKKDMKARGVHSPDFADALAVTYAHQIADAPGDMQREGGVVQSDYDPYEEMRA